MDLGGKKRMENKRLDRWFKKVSLIYFRLYKCKKNEN